MPYTDLVYRRRKEVWELSIARSFFGSKGGATSLYLGQGVTIPYACYRACRGSWRRLHGRTAAVQTYFVRLVEPSLGQLGDNAGGYNNSHSL